MPRSRAPLWRRRCLRWLIAAHRRTGRRRKAWGSLLLRMACAATAGAVAPSEEGTAGPLFDTVAVLEQRL
ncbi:hypothetical protein ACFOPN_13455 [Xanthomonas hyacinthi]|uniref:hypothetical protein n=1 Tax=Xanthomonas hyacinthi TaxID=56455 RepID=UPI00360A95BC